MKELVSYLIVGVVLFVPLLSIVSIVARGRLYSGRMVASNSTDQGPQIGSSVWFAENGATVEEVTVAVDEMPPGTVLTTWREIGCVTAFKPVTKRTGGKERKCYDRTLKKYVSNGTSGELVTQEYEISLEELDDLIYALSNGANGVDESDECVPGGAEAKVRGYLLVKQDVTGTGNEIAVLTVWCDITVTTAPVASSDASTAVIRVEVIPNTNNLLALGNELAG